LDLGRCLRGCLPRHDDCLCQPHHFTSHQCPANQPSGAAPATSPCPGVCPVHLSYRGLHGEGPCTAAHQRHPPPQSHPPTPVPPRTEYIDSCDMVAGPPVSYLTASKGEGRGERGEGRGLGDWATRRSRYHSIYVAWRQKVRRKNFPMQIALEQVSLATRSADSARLSQDLRPT
jgi:hypothetical protein